MWRTLLRTTLFGLAIVAITCSPAGAFKKLNVPGTRTKDDIQKMCTGDGRQYVEGQGQYGCISNCGEPGRESDACGINCSKKTNECYGWTPPLKAAPRTLGGILNPPHGALKFRAQQFHAK
jgi:hypothetical protein